VFGPGRNTCSKEDFRTYQDMNDIETIMDALVRFRDERDWEQFHNAKDLALAINVEAGELLEQFGN
jgi:hypothetical protein